MKIAYIRGDFLSSWEISNSTYLANKHDFTIFVGKRPVNNVVIPRNIKSVSLLSPADLNFGRVNRYKMAVLNRLFVDAHILLGLENALKGFDIAYVSETFYGFTHQALEAKKRGYVSRVISHASENTAFNNESIRGRKEFKEQAIKEMDKFIAITKGSEDVLLKEGCDPKKIVRLYPGVDLSMFRPHQISNFDNLIKNKNIKLLFVGRLVKEKGILEIIRIFENINRKLKNVELIIVGKGPLEKEVKLKEKENNMIHYLGNIPYQHMPDLYSICDLLLHYSVGSKTWIEQYGFTLLEALASGVPVVGINKGSVKELVASGGRVVEQENFSVTLEQLIINDKLRKELSQSAFQIAKKRYNANEHAKDLEKVFKETLSS